MGQTQNKVLKWPLGSESQKELRSIPHLVTVQAVTVSLTTGASSLTRIKDTLHSLLWWASSIYSQASYHSKPGKYM